MPLSLGRTRRSISKLLPFKRRSAVPPLITYLRPNDDGTHYALISPLGSVDGDRDAHCADTSFCEALPIESETDTGEGGIDAAQEQRVEQTTILISPMGGVNGDRVAHYTGADFDEPAPIEIETDTEEDGIVTAQEERIEVTDSTPNPTEQANESSSPTMKLAADGIGINHKTASSNHCFNVGEYVQVAKRDHRHFDARGKIEKITKCYVFFYDERTKTRIQIKPTFLECCANSNVSLTIVSTVETASCDVIGENTASLGGVDGEEACEGSGEGVAADATSCSTKRANNRRSLTTNIADNEGNDETASSNQCFNVGEYVQVAKKGHKYFDARGKIQRMTNCYVIFSDDKTKKRIQIKPTFLERCTNSNGSLTTITTEEMLSYDVSSKSTASLRAVDGGVAWECLEGIGLSTASSGHGLSIEKICFGRSVQATNAFSKFWDVGNYLPPIEVSLKSIDEPDDLPLKLHVGEKNYELYYAEVSEDKSGSSLYTKAKKVTAHYICSKNLREHEENQADFGTLSSSKTWARRQLYLSPAMKLNNEYAVKHIIGRDLTMIEDLGTVGCGFISSKYLEDLLGNNADAKRALGIQIRIFVPTYGVFKGMLMRKRNTCKPIELNDSLRKVAPSRDEDASDDGYIVIKQVFPSKDNFVVGRKFRSSIDPDKKRLKSIADLKGFRSSLATGKSCKMSPMYVRILKGLGVSPSSLECYSRNYKKDPEKLCHTHLVGMADPTNKLPPNSLFVTGMTGSNIDELFIARSPSLLATDGRVIKLVKTKPDEMENDDWDFLQSLTFGAVIFGNPKTGNRPLPELIAGGDLDGDLYFTCWDETIVSQIRRIPITDDDLKKTPDAHDGGKEYDPEWFSKAQIFISQIPKLHLGIDRLICLFYNECIKKDDIDDPDAISFARSYFQALDVKKEGDLIFLPKHLWTAVPEKFQKYLTEK
ncbi:hypothetical protein ACHAW5_005648 [Stephanodiscus triporus]|uniref:RNA-dependent RNA polymerase n=1 Tax=Stephanodiscus triporus TaxID=2934178 RepID=A0ABD3P8Z8_9STRA